MRKVQCTKHFNDFLHVFYCLLLFLAKAMKTMLAMRSPHINYSQQTKYMRVYKTRYVLSIKARKYIIHTHTHAYKRARYYAMHLHAAHERPLQEFIVCLFNLTLILINMQPHTNTHTHVHRSTYICLRASKRPQRTKRSAVNTVPLRG